MPQKSPRQKSLAAKRRQELRAFQMVGHFMLCWNFLESDLTRAVRTLCRLAGLEATILCANLNFQSKMGIVLSIVNLYSEHEPEAWKAQNRKTFKRMFDVNSEWRNVVVHNVFNAKDDGSVAFFRVQAKRELKVPNFAKTKKEFDAVCSELIDLGEKVEKIVKRIVSIRRDVERANSSPPTRGSVSLMDLGRLYLPQSETPHSEKPIPEIGPQTSEEPRE